MAKKTKQNQDFPSEQTVWAIQCEGSGLVYPTVAENKRGAIWNMTRGRKGEWDRLKFPRGCYRAVKCKLQVIES